VYANFAECPKGEVPRIHIPRTPVNKGNRKGRGIVAPAGFGFRLSAPALTLPCYQRKHATKRRCYSGWLAFAGSLALEKLNGRRSSMRSCCNSVSSVVSLRISIIIVAYSCLNFSS
jgi:hypothetical protein